MKIIKQKTNHITCPLGFALGKPTLSWQVCDATAKTQTAAQITVSLNADMSAPVFTSGKQADISSLGYTPALTLAPRTRYYWQVEVWGDSGETAAGISWFETGKMDEPWQAKWISAPFDREIHPYLVKPFTLDEKAVSARLYISGLGLYEAEINGKKAGDEFLAPGYTNYNHWVQYQTYDVTDLLQEGENRLGVILGKGWYQGRLTFLDKEDLFGQQMIVQAELVIQTVHGKTVTVLSDESWLCHASPVVDSGIYDGEWYDARLEVANWSQPEGALDDFVPAKAAAAPIGAMADRWGLPVKIMQRWPKATLIITPANETVIDFEQEITGWVEFDCDLPAGESIQLQFGEILQGGNFYNENLRTAKEQYTYISAGHKAHVRPRFTFYGFRYMKVTGLKTVNPKDFQACVMYSALDTTGELETSNAKVNRLVQNAMWGQKGNFFDVPTDCPQRDERMGWTGDAEVFCGTADFNMDTAAFYGKFLHEMLLEQKTLNGSVPHVVPDVLTLVTKDDPNAKSDGSCVWGDAGSIIPWTNYLFFGDKCQLAREYENMKLWVDYIQSRDDTLCGGRRLWLCDFHFADWLAMDNPDKDSCFGGTDPYYIASSYYFYTASLVAKAAHVLGKTEDCARYTKLAEEVKAAIRQEYFTPTGRLAVPTQTALALALSIGFVPEEFRSRTVSDLKKRLDDRKGYLDTGFVGTYQLCYALSHNGLSDYAYTLLLNEDFPSWLYEINHGATTIWERWNSVLDDGSVSGTGMNSLNHYAYGSVLEWMYRCMCGINPCEDAPGFKKAILHPMPDTRIQYAFARYDSAAGQYRCGWTITDSGVRYEIEIPFDAQATLILEHTGKGVSINGEACTSLLQDGHINLMAGSYTIEVTD